MYSGYFAFLLVVSGRCAPLYVRSKMYEFFLALHFGWLLELRKICNRQVKNALICHTFQTMLAVVKILCSWDGRNLLFPAEMWRLPIFPTFLCSHPIFFGLNVDEWDFVWRMVCFLRFFPPIKSSTRKMEIAVVGHFCFSVLQPSSFLFATGYEFLVWEDKGKRGKGKDRGMVWWLCYLSSNIIYTLFNFLIYILILLL